MRALFHRESMLRWLWLTAILVVLDQLTKQWASHVLEMYDAIEVMPMLNLYLAHNEGAAFSFLSSAGGWQRWFFTAIALVVSVVLVLWIKKLERHETWNAIGLALILSGALGNVIDRILFGYVIDFIQFYYAAQSCLPGFSPYRFAEQAVCIWPAFNIADSAISIGAVMLIWDGIMSMRRTRRDGTKI